MLLLFWTTIRHHQLCWPLFFFFIPLFLYFFFFTSFPVFFLILPSITKKTWNPLFFLICRFPLLCHRLLLLLSFFFFFVSYTNLPGSKPRLCFPCLFLFLLSPPFFFFICRAAFFSFSFFFLRRSLLWQRPLRCSPVWQCLFPLTGFFFFPFLLPHLGVFVQCFYSLFFLFCFVFWGSYFFSSKRRKKRGRGKGNGTSIGQKEGLGKDRVLHAHTYTPVQWAFFFSPFTLTLLLLVCIVRFIFDTFLIYMCCFFSL